MAEACAWQMVLVIPKGDIKEFRGTRLVEVLWKPTTGIINRRLTASIRYHGSLHGLQTGRGTGTATIKDNLIHHMTAMIEAVLHTILLM